MKFDFICCKVDASIMKLFLVFRLFLHCIVYQSFNCKQLEPQANENSDSQVQLPRLCAMFTRGVHGDRDPLDEKHGRGGQIFTFTYKQGHPQADQFTVSKLYETVNGVQMNKMEDNYSTTIKTIVELQEFANEIFNIDILSDLDAKLSPSLGLENLFISEKFTFGFTYSNAYKYERDQIVSGKNVIFKHIYRMSDYQLTLNSSAYALSPEFIADLQKTSQSTSAHASSLIAKYGSLYIREATFGTSATQNDYVPIEFYRLMNHEDRNLVVRFFSGETGAGRKLLERMRKYTPLGFHRRTSTVSRGGDFPRQSRHWNRNRVTRRVMTTFSFAPLSDLITESALKVEVAKMIRKQLLTSVALNFLDIGLIPDANFLEIGETYFSGLQAYVQQTERQFADSVQLNASSLADRAISPFIKLNALALANEFIEKIQFLGLNATEIEKSYTYISRCQTMLSEGQSWSKQTLEELHQALLEIPKIGAAFDAPWYSLFTNWSVDNEKLFKPMEKYAAEIDKLMVAYENVESIFFAHIGLDIWQFYNRCHLRSHVVSLDV